MSTEIAVTVEPTAAEPERGAVWRCGRQWGTGTTLIQVVANDLTALEAALLFKNQDRLGNVATDWAPAKLAALSNAAVAALNAESGGLSPFDIAPSSLPPGTVEDSSARTVIGQRAYRLLQADRRLDIEVVG